MWKRLALCGAQRTRKEGARMVVKIRFEYAPGEVYPFKAITVMDGKEIFGIASWPPEWVNQEEAMDLAFKDAESRVIEKARRYLIGQGIKIPEPREVEI
jgi:hypothetical protein